MSADCVEHTRPFQQPVGEAPQRDIRREKRLLRRAIASSSGPHRIRLQRELAALEDYEREKRQKLQELLVNA